MTNLFSYLLMLVLSAGCGKKSAAQPEPPTPPPAVLPPIKVADPFVLKHQGTYYLYGTNDVNAEEGFPVYRSTDLNNWEGPIGKAGNGNALMKGQSYGTTGFWAPHVTFYNNKFYMFYTANEHIAVATSDSPLGPFTQVDKKPLHDTPREIDPHVFIDEDGKKYLYFVRLINGNKTYGAELNDDLLSVKENTITLCISQSQDWEIASGAAWPVTEAPALLKHKQQYYLFYTGNDFRHPNYNVGYATSTTPLGPWTKYAANPLLKKTSTVQGTGGCEFTTNAAGELLMFYHAHNSIQQVIPRLTVFSPCTFVPATGGGPDILQVSATQTFPRIKQ